ncbi:hypothetical protein [Parablautia intestinalis]|uniref:hypothetical protein n=1 Tax=Parablautia intestinalis TaxID=2320100 RepID=UPI00256EF34C|nr:hypothetical protein [Parablautia intestinalis]
MVEVDLGKVMLTEGELLEKIIQANGGVKLGKDADGNAGYVVTDAVTGADTVIPFKLGGGSIEGVEFLGNLTGGASTTKIQVKLEKKYKIIVLVVYSVRVSSSTYTITITLPRGSKNNFISEQYSVGAATSYSRVKVAFDFDVMGYEIGDVYSATFYAQTVSCGAVLFGML